MKIRIESITPCPKLGLVVFNKYVHAHDNHYIFAGTHCHADNTDDYRQAFPFDPQVSEFVKRMKAEIRADIDKGIVPDDVATFGDLHDWVDANAYGGFCDDGIADALILKFGGRDQHYGMPEDMLAFINTCQDTINAWLQEGRPS